MKDKKVLKIGDRFMYKTGVDDMILTVGAYWSELRPTIYLKDKDLRYIPISKLLVKNVEYGGLCEYKLCIPLPKLFFKPIKKK